MSAGDVKSKCAFGFLTVLSHPQHGLFGGYLVLNASGRPLEFHCTAPVKPNRAQQILYGPTLEPFLYGEQIGQTLLARSKAQPLVVCTDQEPALAVRQLVSVPVTLVLTEQRSSDVVDTPSGDVSGVAPARVDAPHPRRPRLLTFTLGRHRLAVLEQAATDQASVTEGLSRLAESIDLAEPFTRIREAIEEAQRSAC